jgi:hypothetical protein
MDFIQSPTIYFWQRDLGNPRPATDFPRPATQDFLWCHQMKKCVPNLARLVCSFIYLPEVNCPPFQFVIFSYPTGMDHILICNP